MTDKNSTLKTKKIAMWLVVGVAVSVGAAACGMHGKHMSEAMMRRAALSHVDDVMDEIDADDAQRAQFEALAEELVDEALAMKAAHKSKEKAFLDDFRKGTIDRQALHTAMEDHVDTVEEFLSRSLDKVLDAVETLRPEQRQIILDKLADHMENH